MTATPAVSDRARDLAFYTVIIAFAMEVLDSTIVNIAIPAIESELGASAAQVQWITASYFLALAVFLMLGGRLGDAFGYRRIFIIGVAGFTIASMICGLAPNPTTLIAARTMQGAAAAMMAPQVMSVIQVLYTPVERISRLSLFGALGGIIGITGPILGGLLIGWDLFGFGWRMIFLINAPIGLACIAASFAFIPSGGSHLKPRLDWIGFLLIGVTLIALLGPLIEGRESGWPPLVLASLAGSLATGAATVIYLRRRERAGKAAAIAIHLFNERCFSLGLIAAAGAAGVMSGFLLTLSIFLQQGLGYSAFQTALVHVPFALGMSVSVAIIVRRFLVVFEKRIPIAGAMLATTSIVLLLWATSAGAAVAIIALSLLGLGLGLGMVIGPLSAIIFARVDRGEAGGASAVLKTTQQLGAALGVAAIGGVFFTAIAAKGGGQAGLAAGFHAGGVTLIASLCAISVVGASLPARIFAVDRHAPANRKEDKGE